MKGLNDWAVTNLGQWVVDCAALFLILAVGLVVILILACIIAANISAGKNKKIRKLKEANAALGEPFDEEAVRESIRAEYEEQYANAGSGMSDDEKIALLGKIDELTNDNAQKQRTIDRLNDELASAGVAAQGDNAELLDRISELQAENENLRRAADEDERTNLKLANENSLLKAENAQIRAQALQQKLADERRAAKPEPAEKHVEKKKEEPDVVIVEKKAAEKKSETKKAETQPSKSDEYDEYYDDYGDETSAVKVTLKFDRNKGNWVILRSDTDRAYRRLATKQEALNIAKDLARRLKAQLVVHKKDGKFQRI